MFEIDLKNYTVCKTCKYISSVGCSYLLKEGHSRIYDGLGGRIVKKGYCNKYVEKDSEKFNLWRDENSHRYENTRKE